jgi:hypothetical protein
VATFRLLDGVHTQGADGIGKSGTGRRHQFLQVGGLGGLKTAAIFA